MAGLYGRSQNGALSSPTSRNKEWNGRLAFPVKLAHESERDNNFPLKKKYKWNKSNSYLIFDWAVRPCAARRKDVESLDWLADGPM